MQLDHLSIVNYKNIATADLTFSPKLNGLIGSNGMGKTNVLDAIYYLSFCKSAGGGTDAFTLRHDADFFLLQGNYSDADSSATEITIGLKRGTRKRLRTDGKDVKRLAEHVGRIPLVMLSPGDSLLVSGGSEERRHFMDIVISQYDARYLDALIRYEHSLKQRNALLRAEETPHPEVMDVVEEMMSADADVIYAARRAFIDAFLPIFQSLYARLCPVDDERVDIVYETHGTRGPLAPLLRTGREREHIVGYSLHGPHKDELSLLMNGYPVKRECSQGQTKMFFIAMKLSQFVFLHRHGHRTTPLLLLDDIFDKLDAARVARIIDYVGGEDFGQIFITDTNRDHLDHILSMSEKPYCLFHVENGEITSLHTLSTE
jgi:DNA replication and repair protein RecF